MIRIIFLLLVITLPLLSQDFDGIRIYINPGHGGNDPANDRYIPLTGFWESEGNLTKGLYLKALLENAGAVVFISRTQNREEDDLPLSQISADANANNVDYFHSIHSNGLNGNASVNYPLMLFRGYDDQPVFPLAREMGEIMWHKLNAADKQWTYWPYSWVNNRGDWSFYPQWGDKVGLGVLRNLTMPGTLSEGTFHDYLPNSWRLMNFDYREHEAVAIFRSFIELYGLDQMSTGILAGIVRDDTREVTYSYSYNSGLPNDKKLAVNNARVTLLPGQRTYIGDFKNNGFFLFDSLAPGDYQVVVEAGTYAPDTLNAAVQANRTAFANFFLTEDVNRPPQIFATEPANGASGVVTHAGLKIRFSRPMDTGSSTPAFSISPSAAGSITWADNNQTLAFSLQDTFRVATTYQVTIDSSAASDNGIKLAAPYVFTFTTDSDHVRPKISAYSPAAEVDSVAIGAVISVSFDTEMRQQETEHAFSIEPAVTGTFSWDASGKTLFFEPATDLVRKTYYTVTLSTGAENMLGVSIAEPFSFSFTTRQRNEVNLMRSFPAKDAAEISTRLKFVLDFNAPIDAATVIASFALYDEFGTQVPLRGHELNDNRVTFLPRITLQNDRRYHLYIYPGLKDTLNLPLEDTTEVTFRTSLSEYAGTVVEDFEFLGDWQDPAADDSSRGIDAPYTSVSLSSIYKINGSYSAALQYGFSGDSSGLCRLYNATGFEINADTSSVFGLWVFGDYSGNLLETRFDAGGQSDRIVVIDTIDWAGWKLVQFPLSRLSYEGNIRFRAVVVRQIAGADIKGVLYLDDAQYDVVSGITDDDQMAENRVRTFRLDQNYPNPFNPVTRIRFDVPSATHVRLSVFNVLGQHVATLADREVKAGRHEMLWDASGMPSGIYFYRIETGEFVRTRKMILLR